LCELFNKIMCFTDLIKFEMKGTGREGKRRYFGLDLRGESGKQATEAFMLSRGFEMRTISATLQA
jgi:hypothetical protein